MIKRWRLKPAPDAQLVDELSQSIRVDKVLAKLLAQRGIKSYDEAKAFFRPSLDDLHDPFLMKDMDRAVARVNKALDKHEHIMIYGDYDVDGTTAVALMYSFLRKFYSNVTSYIPDRYKEGYGISYQGIDHAHEQGIKLIIALDCGIKAIDKIEYARKKGIDFVICDHHRPGEFLPEAAAVLDPKRKDCPYPFKELSGAGVGLKLAQAICKAMGWDENSVIEEYMDLVAVSIGADIVPITGENRILAYYGLKKINQNPSPGIKAFTIFSKKREFNISDVVFVIAPRINAAGRIKHGAHAVELLTAKNDSLAKELALEVNKLNLERKELDSSITEEALQMIDNSPENEYCNVIVNEEWHKGVIGIVASRLVERYYKPTLVFTRSGDKLAASARSVDGFDVYNAIEACSEYVEQFGGHMYAAGLTIDPANFDAFKKRFQEVVRETITSEQLQPEIKIDSELELSSITPKFYGVLKQFAPFGPGNMNPVFISRDVMDNGWGRSVGNSQQHLKLTLVAEDKSKTYDAIGFNLGEKEELIKSAKTFNATYSLEENEYQGRINIQLRIKDLKEQVSEELTEEKAQ